jgi:hypothetical protein
MANNTKWWWEEKKEFYKRIQNQAIENYKPNYKEWNKLFEKLEKAHIKWLNILVDFILNQWKIIDVNSISANWNILRKKTILPFLWYKDIINILNFIRTYKINSYKKTNNNISAKDWLKNIKKITI